MMMQFAEEVVRLNNEGVRCLQRGSYEDGIRFFASAMARMQIELNNAQVEEAAAVVVVNDNDNDDENYNGSWCKGRKKAGPEEEEVLLGPIRGVAINVTGSSSVGARPDVERMGGTGGGVFGHAFVLTPKFTPGDTQEYRYDGNEKKLHWHDQVMAGCVLLYNIGLAYQCQGLIEERTRTTTSRISSSVEFFFSKALRSYNQINALFFSSGEYGEERKSSSSSSFFFPRLECFYLLNLAVWTNMGAIYANFYQIRETAQCARVLRNLLTDFRYYYCCQQEVPPDLYAAFLERALLFAEFSCMPAAAA